MGWRPRLLHFYSCGRVFVSQTVPRTKICPLPLAPKRFLLGDRCCTTPAGFAGLDVWLAVYVAADGNLDQPRAVLHVAAAFDQSSAGGVVRFAMGGPACRTAGGSLADFRNSLPCWRRSRRTGISGVWGVHAPQACETN